MIKALHLASFDGNIGDIANHKGFWRLFQKYVNSDVEVTNLEIREFYNSWGFRTFNDDFIDLVNTYDFLVIGGGNFFDIKWDYSETGTTLNIPPKILERINIPVIFNGLGVDYNANSCSDHVKDRFCVFFEYMLQNQDRYLVSVRNDDSLLLLKAIMDDSISEKVVQIPDGGFFTSAREYDHPEISANKTVIAVNVANDRLSDRFGCSDNYERYCVEFGQFINECVNMNSSFQFVFIPHIPTDTKAIIDIMQNTPDYICRRNITIAPYLNGCRTPGDYAVDLYRKADLAIGMRYHSNICAIAMGTPTVGIVTLDKHRELYNNIGMQDRLFDVTSVPFSERLCDRVGYCLENRNKMKEENISLVRRLEKESIEYYKRIEQLINHLL